ncbi:hypothetical protein LINGRAHAP2_LOCUS17199 [Linum grandiflorum]
MIPNHSISHDIQQTSLDQMNDSVEYQLIGSNYDGVGHQNAGGIDSCGKDSWWLEAMRVADDIEMKGGDGFVTQMVSQNEIDEDDEMWWGAVERCASQAELMYTSL